MPSLTPFDQRMEKSRYAYYYQRIFVVYQKPVTQVSIAVLLTLGTIIFFALFAIRPTLQTISELLRKINDQQAVLAQAEQKSAALATAQEQYVQIEPNLQALDTAIPQEYAIQVLLSYIESIAGTAKIPLTNIQLDKVEYPLPTATGSDIQELKVALTLKTNYPAGKQFIVALSKIPRLLAIDNLTIGVGKDSKNTSVSSEEILTFSLNCRVFYLNQ